MTIIVQGFLGPLLLTGGLGSSSTTPFVAYAQPAAATVLPDDLVITDIEPAKATVLQ